MAKILYIFKKDVARQVLNDDQVRILSNRLTPDNIDATAPFMVRSDGLECYIFSPNNCVSIKGTSACLGNMIRPDENWHIPRANAPEGTYALFRSGNDSVEIVTDMLASRTIWYALTDELLIASTSQRAITAVLGQHDPDRRAYAWMLSSGNLGPGYSWDKNIKILKGDSRLFLNRTEWKPVVEESYCIFRPEQDDDRRFQERFDIILEDLFARLDLDFTKWVLPLSGGYDSRGILLLLNAPEKLRCVTWGLKKSLEQKENDAYIATSLAARMGCQHQYFETDLSDEPPEKIFERFIVAGEGRVDHLAGYMDGFDIWKQLFDKNILGVIRGDEVFGAIDVASEFGIYHRFDACTMRDFVNLEQFAGTDFPDQHIPDYLQMKAYETLPSWRDRMHQQYRIPFVSAALNDLKLPYVEICNPFLSRQPVEFARIIPDHLRTGKPLFKKVVNSKSPDIPYARFGANAKPGDIMKSPKVVDFLQSALEDYGWKEILSERFADYVASNMKKSVGGRASSVDSGSGIKDKLPQAFKDRLRREVFKHHIDENILAFRAYLICRMRRLLDEDAALFG